MLVLCGNTAGHVGKDLVCRGFGIIHAFRHHRWSGSVFSVDKGRLLFVVLRPSFTFSPHNLPVQKELLSLCNGWGNSSPER